jgi:hypothetical protein
MVARWNIRVTCAYEGLLSVGGPQVDPGWVGHLFCPVYNLSDKKVTLRKGKPIATIDFIKTTAFKKDKSKEDLQDAKEFQRPPERIVLADYKPERLSSALYTDVKKRLDSVEHKVDGLGTKLDRSSGIIFTVLAIIIAAIAIFVPLSQTSVAAPAWTNIISVGVFIAAIIILIVAIVKLTKARH